MQILMALNDALFPSWIRHLKRELQGCTSVLDVGCGKDSPIQECGVPRSVGVDLFDAYLEESKRKRIHTEYVKSDIRTVEFPPGSFDCVMCLEVLEHLTKEEGLALLARMEKWARKKVILTTPNTFVWQDEVDDNPLQAHQSGWTAREFQQLGFKVRGLKGWRVLRGYLGACKYRPMFFWAKLSHISQKIVYFVPSLAFQLFIVKDVSGKPAAKNG
jgi:ubiquinone/menaquinone biosynthesis C-methylase UbiE